jgi:hypothetical protein
MMCYRDFGGTAAEWVVGLRDLDTEGTQLDDSLRKAQGFTIILFPSFDC